MEELADLVVTEVTDLFEEPLKIIEVELSHFDLLA